MRFRQSVAIDLLIGFVISALAVATLVSVVSPGAIAGWMPLAGVAGLVAIALGLLAMQLVTRPDHLKARQSDMILSVANETLPYLRQGLSEASAQEVCRIVLAGTNEVGAVAITDTTTVLGFAGIGEDHHEVGRPVMTAATHEVLESGEHRILDSADGIGCPRAGCLLRAAIVTPLVIRGTPIGALKFYYTTPRLLNETQVAMAEGLAALLSTQLELAELDRQTELATRMELRALQAQINPHFLFNTINTIASLVRTDPDKARDLLRGFAAFYRRTLEEADDMVPLERELEYVDTYLELERARFGDLLSVEESIDDELFDLCVPAFVLQPLVENAVVHGMRPGQPLHIEILSAIEPDDTVVVTVRDDGIGIDPDRLPQVLESGFGTGLGIALRNVHERIAGRFGPGSGLRIDSTPGEGTTVSLVMTHAAGALSALPR